MVVISEVLKLPQVVKTFENTLFPRLELESVLILTHGTLFPVKVNDLARSPPVQTCCTPASGFVSRGSESGSEALCLQLRAEVTSPTFCGGEKVSVLGSVAG